MSLFLVDFTLQHWFACKLLGRLAEAPKQNPCNTSMLQLNSNMWPSLGLIGVLQGGAKWTRLFVLTFQQVLPCFRNPKQVFSCNRVARS